MVASSDRDGRSKLTEDGDIVQAANSPAAAIESQSGNIASSLRFPEDSGVQLGDEAELAGS